MVKISEKMITNPFLEIKKEADKAIQQYLKENGIEGIGSNIDIPNISEFGELSSTVALSLPKILKKSPKVIADDIVKAISEKDIPLISDIENVNGYINFKVDDVRYAETVMSTVKGMGNDYGRLDDIQEKKVVVEHTSVNPNKPWHVGHARNAVLGDSVARLLRAAGYDVEAENYIDDTGNQVAQTLFGLDYFGCDIPEGKKFDHALGKVYVDLHRILNPEDAIEAQIEEAQKALEAASGEGDQEKVKEMSNRLNELDEEIRSIDHEKIESMEKGIQEVMHEVEKGTYRDIVENCVRAQLDTAFRMNIFYDVLIWESDIVQSNIFEKTMELLKKSSSIYEPEEGDLKGCTMLRMSGIVDSKGSDKHEVDKVLIKSDGLPTYSAKDIALQMWKFGLIGELMGFREDFTQPNGKMLMTSHPDGDKDNPFGNADKVINVIGIEQEYGQNVVREGLRVAGFEKEFENSKHLGYEHVWLPEGKMSGRKGRWISTDEILDEAVERAYNVISEKRPDMDETIKRSIAEDIGVSAFRYALLKSAPGKKIRFDWDSTLSLQGNSAPYLQYSFTRMSSILRKAEKEGIDIYSEKDVDHSQLSSESEMNLIKHIARFPEAIRSASESERPDIIADYTHTLANRFSNFYEKSHVINAENEYLRDARIELIKTTRTVMSNAFNILGIKEIYEM